MLITRIKTDEELREVLPEKVFVIHCLGCKEVFFPLEEVLAFTKRLSDMGIELSGEEMTDYLCRPDFTSKRLEIYSSRLKDAMGVLVFSCGVGAQTVAGLTDLPVFVGCDTVNLGGFSGLTPSELECARCGECVLGLTAGICPIANCAKGLANGPCGGAKDGKCEISSEKDCIWLLIYDRLKTQGRLSTLDKLGTFRDYRKGEKEVVF